MIQCDRTSKSLIIIVPLLFLLFSQCNKNTTEPDQGGGTFVVDSVTVTAQASSLTGLAVTAHVTYHFEGSPGSPDRLRLTVLDANASVTTNFSSPIPVDSYTQWAPKITTNDPGTDSVLASFSVSGRFWDMQDSKSVLHGDFAWSENRMVAIVR